MPEADKKIPKRFTTAILNSMGAGVVPNIGLEYIAVGRKNEMGAIIDDINNISDGGGAFRIFVGPYGSGKSFLLQMARNHAMSKNLVVANADMTPEHRLIGSKGQGVGLYRELMRNLSTKVRPEGNAVESLLQRWIDNIRHQVEKDGIEQSDERYQDAVEEKIRETADIMRAFVFGEDMARVLLAYYRGFMNEDGDLRQAALMWIRGELTRKADARVLGVTQLIADDNWYDFLKLLARLTVELGYKGLLVMIDEEVNLYKIVNRTARENNYEKFLSIYNDVLQGRTEYFGVYFCGTPQSVEDDHRGLYSYEALRSRLKPSRLTRDDLLDYSGPQIRLQKLSNEENYLLLNNIMRVFCNHYKIEKPLTNEQMVDFLSIAMARIGADKLLTLREVTRDFISLLNIMRQNPNETYASIMESGQISLKGADKDPDEPDDDRFAEFDL